MCQGGRRQARHPSARAGVTRSRLRWHLRATRWCAVLPSVCAMFTGEQQERQSRDEAAEFGATGSVAVATDPVFDQQEV